MSLLILLISGAFSLVYQSPLWLGFILLIIPVYGLNRMAYKHLGYLVEPEFFITRRGLLSRHSHIIPYRSVQSVLVRQSPFDRRHNVATFQLDSAGQTFTGGPPKVKHMPIEKALEAAKTTAQKASKKKFSLH